MSSEIIAVNAHAALSPAGQVSPTRDAFQRSLAPRTSPREDVVQFTGRNNDSLLKLFQLWDRPDERNLPDAPSEERNSLSGAAYVLSRYGSASGTASRPARDSLVDLYV